MTAAEDVGVPTVALPTPQLEPTVPLGAEADET